MRILVADDNTDAAESLAELFELTGHEVRTALDGEHAVEVARQWPPDAAVLDLQMPVLDGRAVAAILRRQRPAVVLVALSGQMNAHEMKICRAVFDLCFAKGVEFQEIARQLAATLDERLQRCRVSKRLSDRDRRVEAAHDRHLDIKDDRMRPHRYARHKL